MGKRKELIGEVVSDKMQKTRVVRIVSIVRHAKYGRINKKYTKFNAHDEGNISKAGDTVKIQETRPISKNKFFRIASIVKKAQLPHVELKEEKE